MIELIVSLISLIISIIALTFVIIRGRKNHIEIIIHDDLTQLKELEITANGIKVKETLI